MKFNWRQSFDILIGGLIAVLIIVVLRMGLSAAWGTPPKPMTAPAMSPCYVALQICQSQLVKKIAPDFIYVLYSWVVRVGNPVESPDGCVRVTGGGGRGIYVVGTEQEILDDVADARHLCYQEQDHDPP